MVNRAALDQLLESYVAGTIPENPIPSPERKPSGHWKDINNIRRALEELERELGHFPSRNELRERGYSGLQAVIQNNYGGMKAIAKELGIIVEAKRMVGDEVIETLYLPLHEFL